jgi:hypothetical protein
MNPPLPPIQASDEIPHDGYTELHPAWLDDTIREIRAVAGRAKGGKLTPIRPQTQQLAARLLASIEADNLPVPEVDYYLPGGVSFGWATGERQIEIVVMRNGSVVVQKRLDGEKTFYKHNPTGRDVTPMIRRTIDWCIPRYAATQTADIDLILSRGLTK